MSSTQLTILGPQLPDSDRVLTPDALGFVAGLCERFEPRRQALLATRRERRKTFQAGALPDFLRDTISIREGPGGWRRRRRT